MDTKLFSAIFLLFCLIGVGTWVFHTYEGWGYVDSFYVSVMTITTIGYSDLSPTLPQTKLFTAFYALSGISIALYAMSILNKPTIEQLEKIPVRLHPHFFNNDKKV